MAKRNKKQVEEFMNGVRNFLTNKYGKIDLSWEGGLYLLQDNYSTFLACQDDIDKDGLFLTNRFGDKIANPAIKMKNDAQIQMVKLLNEYGLTAHANGKLKENDSNDVAEILDNLMN